MQTLIAMGFSPSSALENRPFQFISARAVFASAQRQWLHLGNPATQFPPTGTFYVPKELIPDSFRGAGSNVAAWVLEDQPDWQVSHLGARFRANSPWQPPAEIITLALVSSDVEAVRRLLLDDGLSYPIELTGRPVMIEFEDGLIAGPFKFYAQSDSANRYVCDPGALMNPIRHWPVGGEGSISRCVLTWSDRQRIFAADDPLPRAGGDLFLAPLDELIRRANLAGGVGSQRRTVSADIDKQITSLQQALESLPPSQVSVAIVQRLRPLIDRAQLTYTAQTALDEYLAKHPFFDQAVQKLADDGVAALRESIRLEVLGQEAQLRDAIDKLRKQHDDDKQRLAQEIQNEQKQVETRRREIDVDLVRLQKEREELSQVIGELTQVANSLCRWKTSVAQTARVLASPNETLEHLTKNLGLLGLLPASAQNMAREAFAAACLGQMLMFRGSFALPLARVVAQSLSGNCVHYLSVPVGLIIPIPAPPPNSADQISVLLIEGLNRSCFDSYSGEVAVILEERCLGLRPNPDPIVIGVLLDAPSSVPPSPTLLSCGPVFSADHLSWKASLRAQHPAPGRCLGSAWKVDPRPFNVNNLVPENAALSLRGRRNIAAAGTVLATLASSANKEVEEVVDASLLFGWVYPYLKNGDDGPFEVAMECRNRWQSAIQKDPQRLGRLLRLDGSKENS